MEAVSVHIVALVWGWCFYGNVGAVYCTVCIWEPIDGKETPLDFNLLCDGVWKLYVTVRFADDCIQNISSLRAVRCQSASTA